MLESTANLYAYLEERRIPVVAVGNRRVENSVRRRLPRVLPAISFGCFQYPDDESDAFCQDMVDLDHELQLTDDDIVIVLTSHIHEIQGLSRFVRNHLNGRRTAFSLLLHQLYPPRPDFHETCDPQFRVQIHNTLGEALACLPPDVGIWSTCSDRLNRRLRLLARRAVGQLPLPFREDPNGSSRGVTHREARGRLTCSFLGDNRYEKGLLILLRSIAQLGSESPFDFVIQNCRPRCYGEATRAYYQAALASVSGFSNTEIIDGPLGSTAFRYTITNADAIILPYHPMSYDCRVSGVLVQALLAGVPAICTRETWLGEMVDFYQAGETFGFNPDLDACAGAIASALKALASEYAYCRCNATDAAARLAAVHNPAVFMALVSHGRIPCP